MCLVCGRWSMVWVCGTVPRCVCVGGGGGGVARTVGWGCHERRQAGCGLRQALPAAGHAPRRPAPSAALAAPSHPPNPARRAPPRPSHPPARLPSACALLIAADGVRQLPLVARLHLHLLMRRVLARQARAEAVAQGRPWGHAGAQVFGQRRAWLPAWMRAATPRAARRRTPPTAPVPSRPCAPHPWGSPAAQLGARPPWVTRHPSPATRHTVTRRRAPPCPGCPR